LLDEHVGREKFPVNQRRRQRYQSLDDSIVSRGQPFDEAPAIPPYPRKILRPAKPQAVVVAVVAQKMRCSSLVGQIRLPGKMAMHSRQPTSRVMPGGPADLVQRASRHVLDEEPVTAPFMVDNGSIASGRTQSRGIENRPVRLYFPERVVKK